MTNIAIVDYGMANLRSVQKAFERVGAQATITNDPEQLRRCRKLVLPGVGAFRDAIALLRATHLDESILEHLKSGKPFLGICLGMQMLFSRSFEDGTYTGLDIFAGDVVRFTEQPNLKIPHMGWNQLHFRGSCPLFRGIANDSSVYFVHSFYAQPNDSSIVAAEADYPTPFTAAVWRDHIFATQFHPEKSQTIGLKMLQNFAEL